MHLKHSRLNVSTVAGNPLFLTMMCVEYEAMGKLSSTTAQLFEQFIRILLEIWDIERGVIRRRSTTTLPMNIKLRVLGSIASYFYGHGRIKFPESELLARVEMLLQRLNYTINSEDVINEIESTSGLITKDRKCLYQFCHPLFQEFFVARNRHEKGIRGENQREWIKKHFYDPRYANVMQFYSELLKASQKSVSAQ